MNKSAIIYGGTGKMTREYDGYYGDHIYAVYFGWAGARVSSASSRQVNW